MKNLLLKIWAWFWAASLRTKGLVLLAVIAVIIMIRNFFKAHETIPAPTSVAFNAIVLPTQKMRNDTLGLGHFGASRDGGTRTHEGVDILVYEGQPLYSPFEGILTKEFYPYSGDTRFYGFDLVGTGRFEGLKVRIMYCRAIKDKIGKAVKAGELVGYAQKISKKYSVLMKDHIHVEVYEAGVLVDPTTHIKLTN